MVTLVSLVEELEYVRLYDQGDYYVIEDKVLIQYPMVSRSQTKTLIEMWFDLVELPNGDRLIARAYYPKSIPKQIVLNTLHTWNEKWKKKIQEVQPLLQMQQAQQPATTSEQVMDELNESLKRIREYLQSLG